MSKKQKKKVKPPKIFLYNPMLHNRKDIGVNEQLKQVVPIYMYSLNHIDATVDDILVHLKAALPNRAMLPYTMAHEINFRFKEGGEVYSLPIINFLYNLILMSPALAMGIKIKHTQIFRPVKLTDGEIVKYINDMIIAKYKDKTNFYTMCEYLEFVKIQFNKITVDMGERLMMSISYKEFISLMKESEETRKTLTCTYDIAEDIKPHELEKMSMDRINAVQRHIISRTDLSMSNYVTNGLFNTNQFKEFGSHITFKPNFKGETIPMTANTNIIQGLNDPISSTVDGFGGRKAEYLKLKVSEAGVLEKNLANLLEDIDSVDMNHICNSPHHRRKHIDSPESLLRVEGRFYTDKPDGTHYQIVGRKDTHLIGKTVYLKTPISCTHPKVREGVICRGCYSELLAVINQERHVGKVTAFFTSNEFQQILLSAKHSNTTTTGEISFNTDFDNFFRLEYNNIVFNDEFMDLIMDSGPMNPKATSAEDFVLQFNCYGVHKRMPGEGAKYDRCVKDIIIYHKTDDQTYMISETTEGDIFFSPRLSHIYKTILTNSTDDIIEIPFSELYGFIEDDVCEPIFEIVFKNKELAESLNKVQGIFNRNVIKEYQTYDQILDETIPYFIKGGVKLMDIHVEIIISRLICNSKGKLDIDWYADDPEYTFQRMEAAILNKDALLPSLIFRNPVDQLGGKFGTYEKRRPSCYDAFIADV